MFWLVAVASATAVTSAGAQNATNVIKPGDVLRVAVWREAGLSGDFVVNAEGLVAHPIYKDVKVSGKTIAEVEGAFRQVLATLITNPQFVVEPLVRIDVAGEVRAPNLYLVSPLTTVAQAVALAGGTTNEGKRDRVRVLRQGGDIVVDLNVADGPSLTPVRSGDHILVERKRNVFREVIAPVAAVAAALASVVNIILNQ